MRSEENLKRREENLKRREERRELEAKGLQSTSVAFKSGKIPFLGTPIF